MRIGWITRGIVLLASVLAASVQAQTIELPHLSNEATRREAAREVAQMLERALAEVEAGRLVVVEAEPPLEFLILDPELERSPMTSDPGAMAAARSALREARAISGERGTDPVVDRIGPVPRAAAVNGYQGTWRIRFIVGDTYGRMTLTASPGQESLAGMVAWDDGNVDDAVLTFEGSSSVRIVLSNPRTDNVLLLDGRVEEPLRRMAGAVLYDGRELSKWEAVPVDPARMERSSTTADPGEAAVSDYRGTWHILAFAEGQWNRGRMNLDHSPGHEGLAGTIVWEDGAVENALLEVDDPLFAQLTIWEPGSEEAIAFEARVEEPGRRLSGSITLENDVELLRWEATRVDRGEHGRRNQ